MLAEGHAPNRSLLVPPGDDAALVPITTSAVLFAADMLLEGVHFDLQRMSAQLVGRKALAVNLSDIAAMAGTPRSVTVSLALPRQGGMQLAETVSAGLAMLAAEHDVSVAGGDTNSWDGPLVVAVAVLGEPHRLGSVTRAGARPGDVVLVTGELGGSLPSGRHLSFAPRLAEARHLKERYGVTAMIDLSDGLAADLRHILVASGVGACLDRARIPVSAAARQAAATSGRPPLEHALGDGEDFELCFTAPPAAASRLVAEQPFAPTVRVTAIGEITAAGDLAFTDKVLVPALGYRHPLA